MRRQYKTQCVCGSWYLNDENCSNCGILREVDESFYLEDTFSKEGKEPQGNGWNKEQHKVEYKK